MSPVFHKTLASAATLLAVVVGASPSACAEELILPVPTTTIHPGRTIRDDAIIHRGFPASYRARVPITQSRSAVVGKIARRTLFPGEPIPANAVDEPDLVLRGAPTEVIFEENGLRITAVGSPLESGGIGAVIRVRNTDTGRIVVGRVQADGKIRISVP